MPIWRSSFSRLLSSLYVLCVIMMIIRNAFAQVAFFFSAFPKSSLFSTSSYTLLLCVAPLTNIDIFFFCFLVVVIIAAVVRCCSLSLFHEIVEKFSEFTF